jgi:class 3 adenylate cyclase
VHERETRSHFQLVGVIELRTRQLRRGQALSQRLVANILPAFIGRQLRRRQSLTTDGDSHDAVDHSTAREEALAPGDDDDMGAKLEPAIGPGSTWRAAGLIARSYSSISVMFATVLVETLPGEPLFADSSCRQDSISRRSWMAVGRNHVQRDVGQCTQNRQEEEEEEEEEEGGEQQMTHLEAAQIEHVMLLDDIFALFDGLVKSTADDEQPHFSCSEERSPAARVRAQPTKAGRCQTYEKIKTIGDTYMVAVGLPHRPGQPEVAVSAHVLGAIELALLMQRAVADFNRGGAAAVARKVQLRVGIHCGPVTAGVIGAEKYCFDIWGDTVNVASRMSSSGIPGRVQLSAAARQALLSAEEEPASSLPGCAAVAGQEGEAARLCAEQQRMQQRLQQRYFRHFEKTVEMVPAAEAKAVGLQLQHRGTLDVKGKGQMDTFLLADDMDRLPEGGQLVCRAPVAQEAGDEVDTAAERWSQQWRSSSKQRDAAADDPRVPSLKAPVHRVSLLFKDAGIEAAFRNEYPLSVHIMCLADINC